MTKRKLFGRCHVMALAIFIPFAPVIAQTGPSPYPASGTSGPTPVPFPVPPPPDPLAMNLKILAQNPYDVNALTSAGIGALEVGDPQAAVGFLARAEELSPRDGRIKSALGSALTMLERPEEAIRTFGEAIALGYPERLIVKDRGLAFDLLGDQKRAQKDYLLAERGGLDLEVVRRHALSLGISGEKEAALKLIDPLIRRNDQSAWRARAFILALNGDMNQADQIIRAATPVSALGGMSAFLRRLPSLTAAQRASAVNFGTIPTTGPIYAAAEPQESFRSIGGPASEALMGPSASPSRTQTASAASAVRKLSRTEIRQQQKREKELAKLAAKGAKAAGVAPPVQVAMASPPLPPPAVRPVVPPAPAPVVSRPVTAPVSQRVGTRIGPVDPDRLPEELRAPQPGAVPPTPSRVVVVQGANTLPPPDTARVPAPSVVAATPPPPLPPVIPPAPPLISPAAPSIAAVPPPSSIPTKVAPTPSITEARPVVPVPAPVPPPAVVVPEAPVRVAAAIAPPPTSVPAPAVLTPPPVTVAAAPVTPPAVAPVVPAGPPIVRSVDLPSFQPVTASMPPAPTKPVELAVVTPPPVPPTVTPSRTDGGIMGPPAPPPSVDILVPAAPAPGFTAEAATSGAPSTGAATNVVPAPEPAAPKSIDLGSVIAGLEVEPESAAAPLPTAAQIRAQRLAAQRKVDEEEKQKALKEAEAKAAKEAEAKKAEEKAAQLKANPARIWVQVATGANRSGLPITWRKLKGDAPKALGEKSGWFMPVRATYRLLTGPVKSQGEARNLVTALSKEGVNATIYTSDAGQEVTRLGGK